MTCDHCTENAKSTIEYLKTKIELIERENTILKGQVHNLEEMVKLSESIMRYVENGN